ncbi:MAG: hypothetical protein EHM34_09830, partial [Nitrosopumilales archaeon]
MYELEYQTVGPIKFLKKFSGYFLDRAYEEIKLEARYHYYKTCRFFEIQNPKEIIVELFRMTENLDFFWGGLCMPKTNPIVLGFNIASYACNYEHLITDTIPHEVAHAIVANKYPSAIE